MFQLSRVAMCDARPDIEMQDTAWTIFLECRLPQGSVLCFTWHFVRKQYCIFIHFFKEMSEVEGQKSSWGGRGKDKIKSK